MLVPMAMEPLRGSAVGLELTLKLNVAFPAPDAALLRTIQGSEGVAVHVQVVVKPMAPLPPLDANFCDAGTMA